MMQIAVLQIKSIGQFLQFKNAAAECSTHMPQNSSPKKHMN